MTDLKAYLKDQQRRVDEALDRFLPDAEVAPATIHKAMRHSIFAGGKRLRPILCLAAAEACGAGRDHAEAMRLACSLECLHTFSLIHDDLPCMDDDDFRRGQPTCHKVYGEAVAVLAGDALQAIAFELAAEFPGTSRYTTTDAAREIAVVSGSLKIVAGQVMDIEGEGRDLSFEELRAIHERKTAALLTTSVRFGGIAADAAEDQLEALTTFGRALGLAFQVIDDILDVTATTEQLGKTAGKDEAVGKATYPAILGLDESREEARRLTAEAKGALAPFGGDAATLLAIADYMLDRDY